MSQISLHNEIEQLRTALNQKHHQFDDERRANHKLKQQISKLEDENKELRNTINSNSKKQSKHQDQEQSIRELEKQNSSLEQAVRQYMQVAESRENIIHRLTIQLRNSKSFSVSDIQPDNSIDIPSSIPQDSISTIMFKKQSPKEEIDFIQPSNNGRKKASRSVNSLSERPILEQLRYPSGPSANNYEGISVFDQVSVSKKQIKEKSRENSAAKSQECLTFDLEDDDEVNYRSLYGREMEKTFGIMQCHLEQALLTQKEVFLSTVIAWAEDRLDAINQAKEDNLTNQLCQ